MNFWKTLWDLMKAGAMRGFWLGISLDVILIAFSMYRLFLGLPNDYGLLIIGDVFLLLVLVLLGGLLGGLAALIGTGTVTFINFIKWATIVLGGGILTGLNFGLSVAFGWTSAVVIPILLVVRQYLSKKAPEWVERALNESIVMFLTSVSFTLLALCFEFFTHIPLRGF
jgi:hypothetical protein